MKKNDVILVSIILVVAVAGLLVFSMTKKSGNKVKISVAGQTYQTEDLEDNQIIDIHDGHGHENKLEIKDGKVYMLEANCPDQLCVHQREISKQGESIICLPNQVIVTIESEEKADLDSVAN